MNLHATESILRLHELAYFALSVMNQAVTHPNFDPETLSEHTTTIGALAVDYHLRAYKIAGAAADLHEDADLFTTHPPPFFVSEDTLKRKHIFLRDKVAPLVWGAWSSLHITDGARFVALPVDGFAYAHSVRDPLHRTALRVDITQGLLTVNAAVIYDDARA